MRALLCPLLLVGLALLPATASATIVQGTLTTSTVWKQSGSPYVLKGDVTVGWGVTLVIEPGVKVIAAMEDALRTGVDSRRVELTVDGALVVRGTAAQPVVFTSRGDRGAWYGIRVRGGRGTVIDGALIHQAQQGLSLGMSAVVRNTSVSATVDDCVHVSWGRATLVGNRLSGCGENGLSVGEWAGVRMEKTVVMGSGRNGAELRGGGELLHNTFHDNEASGVVLLSRNESPVLRDSLITANKGHGVYKSRSARGVLLYNNVWGNGSGDYGAAAFAGPGSISRDPLYVSSADLRLGSDSPGRGVASDGRDLGALQAPRLAMAVRAPAGRVRDSSSLTSVDTLTPRRVLAGASVRGRQLFPVAGPQHVPEGVVVTSAAVRRAGAGPPPLVDARDFVPVDPQPQPVAFISSVRRTGGVDEVSVGRRGRGQSRVDGAPKVSPRPTSRLSGWRAQDEGRVKAAPSLGAVPQPVVPPAREHRLVEVSSVPVSPAWGGLERMSASGTSGSISGSSVVGVSTVSTLDP